MTILCVGLFLALCSFSLICVSVFMPVSYCFDYCRLVVQFEIRDCDMASFVFLFSKLLCLLGSFVVPQKF